MIHSAPPPTFLKTPKIHAPIRSLSVLALVLLTSTVGAQQNPLHGEFEDYLRIQEGNEATARANMKEAVESCVAIVRTETNERLNYPISQFDAYVKANDAVSYFGTDKELFSFEKCMTQRGIRSAIRKSKQGGNDE